jgi:hypothetical protein
MSDEQLVTTNEVEENIVENIEEVSSIDDLNKRSYVKISPTFYVKYVKTDEPTVEGEEKKEFYKIFNPETLVVETRELTDEEKHEILVKELRDSKVKFRNTIHKGKVTITKFNNDYRKKRQSKNKMAKASRKANRK